MKRILLISGAAAAAAFFIASCTALFSPSDLAEKFGSSSSASSSSSSSSASSSSSSVMQITWQQAVGNGLFGGGKRYDLTSVAFNNNIWVIGGSDQSTYYNDVWYSSDGNYWFDATNSTGVIPFTGRYGHTSVVFKNSIWVIGGFSTNGSPAPNNYFPTNDVWYSGDGTNWNCATSGTGFPVRFYHTSVVYNNKIWVIGGGCSGEGPQIFYNDVWYSSDGTNWNKATANAAFSQRYGHSSVVFNNLMWVIGGYQPGSPNLLNDAWYSSDGTNWYSSTTNASFTARQNHISISTNNLMYVIGGANGLNCFNDVWYTGDGTNWTRAVDNDLAFGARSSFTGLYFNNKIWVIAGAGSSGAYYNDIWYFQ